MAPTKVKSDLLPLEGAVLPAPPPDVKLTPPAKKAIESGDSSEEDLNALEKSSTARSQKAKRRKESLGYTANAIKSISCFAIPDGNEATAPHRMRHLRDRMICRAAYEAAAGGRSSAESRGAAPTSDITEAAQNTSRSDSCSGRLLPCGKTAAPPELTLRVDPVCRPRRAQSLSEAEAEKATASAIASLLN